MARVGYIKIPEAQIDKYWGAIQVGDRYVYSRVIRKNAFFSRKKVANLTAMSYLPAIGELWAEFTDQQKADWKDVDPHPQKHGWRTFVADQSKRIKLGIPGVATPNQYHQDLVGAIDIQEPADEVKLVQLHPSQYWVNAKITGKKSMYEPVSVTESLFLPLKISINYKSNLVSTGEGSFAKFYAEVRHFYQGRNIDTMLEIDIPLDSVLTDNFDSYNDGLLAGQGGWWGDPDFIVGAAYRYGDSGKGIKGDGGERGDRTVVVAAGSKAKGKLSFKCQPKATDKGFGIYLTSPGGDAGYYMFWDTGAVLYFNGVELKEIKSSYNADQWYQCQIEWDADRGVGGEIRYKIDNEEWTEWDTPAVAFNTIEGIVMYMSAPGSIGWFDDFAPEWKTDNATLSSVLGVVSSYNLYIHLYKVRGTLLFDNPKAEHSAQNWVRDPYCKNIGQSFTKAFYQIPKHWAAVILPVGSDYDSYYPS